ncbi:factor 3 subunit L [Seminavis robusta]|uniref:Eukaryotic translation initiation factor 3 subunit L n=1 Tax=Seminavis robusta TaxID=568900 RepID=A0A9N8DHY6_9STRA|nr:factor 3 subunit L [Seminavis robusta]|eukprot:Sro162_g072770.1 factor 3 subunit L (509) ;mRNA; f:21788-23434
MAADSDACVPKALTDFVFDLYDSVTLSHIAEEQKRLYNSDFRDLSSKYFASTPWPSPQTIATECNGDPLFLALYRELTHRHWHAVSRINIRDRMEGWQVYRELFEEILQEEPNFYITPGWAFDILNEFVYQFQGFCQFRTNLHSNAVKYGLIKEGESFGSVNSSGPAPPQNVIDNINMLTSADAWEVEQVFSYLHRLVKIGITSERPAYQYLGLFASVALSRLECLLGDYSASLKALMPISDAIVVKKDDTEHTAVEIIQSVFLARLSMAYHAGISFMMLRRYKDASRIWGDICAYMQRGFKTGQLRKLPNSDQFNKQYERMISLLAIVTHICPPAGTVEESILRTIREKHGPILSKIDAGEEGYEDLFMCPKFVTASFDNVYKLQMRAFSKEMAPQHACRKLRSYMKLYTSVAVSKLAKFNDMEVDDFVPLLISYKYRMLQPEAPESNMFTDDATSKSALDIHYYLVEDLVHVDEAEKERRFEKYFVGQISQNAEILGDAMAINTTI